MTNPFDDTHGTFHVLVNEDAQYSLWPVFAGIPAGWRPVLEDATHDDALAFVEANWAEPGMAGTRGKSPC
ncbi:MbtH family protein [Amycolatopsis alba]|uniref:MbtH family protein n=1 Tax=Amycolatopsis alba DSM 44262 TaxID=1125972 RepID=A0A229S2D7_AMYAL|nr:MbtH family protein [Amycolatopsis alba]OXM53092.1 MbtH family protein [Amycolatopsis alba DSM 44262]